VHLFPSRYLTGHSDGMGSLQWHRLESLIPVIIRSSPTGGHAAAVDAGYFATGHLATGHPATGDWAACPLVNQDE